MIVALIKLLQGMSAQIMNGEEGKECMRAYSAILASLQKYEETHREEWAHEIDAQVCRV